jgi:hypothetical protein
VCPSHLCYLHVIRALPPDVVTAIRDVTSNITAESLNAYDAVKQALLQQFTCSELQRCFQLLDAPPLGDHNIATHYSQLRSLIPTNGDILFNAIFLHTLPAHISTALADRAELPSTELAATAAHMQHTVTAQAAVAAAIPLPPSPPLSISAAPSQCYSRSAATPYRRRSNSHDNRRSPSQSSGCRLCWYHQKFGQKFEISFPSHNAGSHKLAIVRPSIVTGKTNFGSSSHSYRLSAIADRSRPTFPSPSSPTSLPHRSAHQHPLPDRHWCSSQPHSFLFYISTIRTHNS